MPHPRRLGRRITPTPDAAWRPPPPQGGNASGPAEPDPRRSLVDAAGASQSLSAMWRSEPGLDSAAPQLVEMREVPASRRLAIDDAVVALRGEVDRERRDRHVVAQRVERLD